MNLQDIQNAIATADNVDELNEVSKMLKAAIAARKEATPKGKVGRKAIVDDVVRLAKVLKAIRDNDADNMPHRPALAKLMDAGFIEHYAAINDKNRAIRAIRLTEKGEKVVAEQPATEVVPAEETVAETSEE